VADKGKILVVDDDRLVVVMLTYGLSQAGYDVIAADNGDDAIQMARERRPALALLDIRMEGKSGFEVATVLREQHQIPFMFLSGHSDDETVRKVKALGALAHLSKPLDINKIVPAVDAAFSNLNARRAAALSARARSDTTVQPTVQAQGRTQPQPLGPPEPMTAAIAMAVGVLMHRYSLARAPALDRLRRMAQTHSQSVADHAERILEAVETLSPPSRQ
jgi:two-component system, response regulator PdtaR